MASRFRLIRKHLAPRWLTEGDGELIGYSLDIVKDAFVERLRLGLMARFPQQDAAGTPAPDDVLSVMGRDRRVVKGIAETSASYASRLRAWLDDRRNAGNAYALMQKLWEYTGTGTKFRTVDVAGNWYTRDTDGTRTLLVAQGNWDWDGDTDAWARFWVIVYPGALWSAEGTWGTSTWGDGGTWGSTATLEEVQNMKALVQDWKPAGTTCVNIIIAFDNSSFDPTAPEPDGLWGAWSKLSAGTQVESRLGTARYWDGA